MSRKNTLIVLAGISGSGKSTFAKMLTENSDVGYVCPDLIRKQFYEDESIQGDGKMVFQKAFQILSYYGSNCDDCVFDATNTTKKARKQVIKQGRKHFDFILCYYFAPNLDNSIINQTKRERQVPIEIMVQQIEKWQTPTIDEGFDYVCEIKY